MKSQNTKSSDELKREVDQQINKVKNDLNSLQGRLTPGQLIDDAIFYPHGRSLSSTIDHLKRNPVGTTFLSLGTILLMEDENHQTMEMGARNRITTVKDSMTSVKDAIKNQLPHKELSPGMAPNRGDIAKGKLNQIKDTVQSKVADLKDKLPTREELKSKVADVKETVTDKAAGVKENISTTVDTRFGLGADTEESNFSFDDGGGKARLKERASEMFSTGKERAADMFESGKERVQNMDPLSYMALGAGLGALTGAALPITEREQSLMNSKFDDKLGGLGSDLQEAINECSNILKDLVINDVKDFSFRPFK